MSTAIDDIKKRIIAYLDLESQDVLSRRDLADEGRLLAEIETLRIKGDLSDEAINKVWVEIEGLRLIAKAINEYQCIEEINANSPHLNREQKGALNGSKPYLIAAKYGISPQVVDTMW
jgi:hypothetical protein